jgi:hypothetical protein
MLKPADLSAVLSVVVFVASARLQPANNAPMQTSPSEERARYADTLFDIG